MCIHDCFQWLSMMSIIGWMCGYSFLIYENSPPKITISWLGIIAHFGFLLSIMLVTLLVIKPEKELKQTKDVVSGVLGTPDTSSIPGTPDTPDIPDEIESCNTKLSNISIGFFIISLVLSLIAMGMEWNSSYNDEKPFFRWMISIQTGLSLGITMYISFLLCCGMCSILCCKKDDSDTNKNSDNDDKSKNSNMNGGYNIMREEVTSNKQFPVNPSINLI